MSSLHSSILAAAAAAFLCLESLPMGQAFIPNADSDFAQHHELQHRRRLLVGDFDRFNQLFAGAELVIPDDAIDVPSDAVKLTVTNLFCRDIYLGDMQTSHFVEVDASGRDVLAYSINVAPFSMTCEADFTYETDGIFSWIPIQGRGRFVAVTAENTVSTRIDLSGPSTFAQEPPNMAAVNGCTTVVQTNGNIDMQLEGPIDALGDLDVVEELISNLVDNAAGGAVCDALSDLGPSMLGDLLNRTDMRFDKWLAPASAALSDPLFAENNYVIPEGVTLVHLQNNSTNGSVSDAFVKLLKDSDSLFGEAVTDEVTGETDLGINVLLRQTLLNGTSGVWEINLAELEDFDPILFDSNDRLTRSVILIDGMRISGLDSLQTFTPFEDIGAYTISNAFSWEKLSIEVDLTVDIKPSVRPDAILRSGDSSVNIVEQIQINLDLSSLNVTLAIFMAIDQARFESIYLGSFLESENLLPCFLSTMSALEVSGLNVEIGDIGVPVLDGFDSPGIGRVLSQLADAAFVAYEPTLLRAMPGIFQGPVRKLIQTRFLSTVLQYGDEANCPPVPILSGDNGEPATLDFRDLFLQPEQAKALGGSGMEPYGNVGHLAYDLLLDQFSKEGEDGLPQINEIVVRRFTVTQSGEEGLIRWPRTLFEFGNEDNSQTTSSRVLQEQNNSLLNNFGGLSFSLGDIRISNLDTIVNPMQLLNLTDKPFVIRNSADMGGETARNLTLTFKVLAGFDDVMNDIDISASIKSLSLFADISAMMDANAFLQFPLGEILNFNCWLAALHSVDLDRDGFAVDAAIVRSLVLEDFRTTISSFDLQSTCISCLSPGTKLLSELIQIQKESDVILALEGRIPGFLRSFSMSDTTQTFFDRLVADAPKFCPSSPEYSPAAVKTEYDRIGFPSLSGESIDTLLFSGVVAAEVAFVVFAETQRLKDIVPSSPLSSQDAFVAPDGIRLLDWTDIGNSTGLSGIADEVFKQARKFLSSGSENVFDFKSIVTGLLGDDGTLEVETDFMFQRDNIYLGLDSVKIKGLDSFSVFDVFEPIGPQTLSTSLRFDALDVELFLSAGVPLSSDPMQTISARFVFQNVSADIALFAAFDLDKVGELALGSLLDTKSLVKCILSAAHAFDIPQLKVSLGSFATPVLGGLLPDTANAANRSISVVFDRFRSEIQDSIPAIFDGVGKDIIAGLLDSADEGYCSGGATASSDGAFLDFRDLLLRKEDAVLLGGSGQAQYGDLISRAFQFIRKELFVADKDTGLAAINRKVIEKLGEAQSGSPGRLFYEGDIVNGGNHIEAGGLDAIIGFRVYDAYVNNVDTVGVPLILLDPMKDDGQALNNSISIGMRRSLQLGTRLFFELSGSGTEIQNDLDIQLSMDTLKVLLTGLATISEERFLRFPIQDIANLQCWLATIPSPQLDARGVRVDANAEALSVKDFAASVANLNLNISCVECSGPRIPELSNLLSSLEDSQTVTDLANGAFDVVTKLFEGNFLQLTIDRALNDARKRCPHSSEYDANFKGFNYEQFEMSGSEDGLSFIVGMLIVGLVLVVGILVVAITTKLFVQRRHSKWVNSLSATKRHQLWKVQSEDDKRSDALNDMTTSMFESEALSTVSRWCIPLVLLTNIGFFLSGHLSLGASVAIIASIGGETFTEDGFFEISIAQSTVKIWEAGGQELAILVFIASFLWPYAKQIITLVLWFTPPSRVSVARRGSILLWFDVLAKWSMIDIFVLIVTIVSFRVSVKSPDVDFLPADFYSIDLLVVPKWGLYAMVVAQIICQVSSHVIIHYHRRIVYAATNENDRQLDLRNTRTALMDEEFNEMDHIDHPTPKLQSSIPIVASEPTVQLCKRSFKRPHRGESDKLVARRVVSPFLVFMATSVCILAVVGCIVPSYSLNALGIVGLLVESGQKFGAAEKSYSVFTTIVVLFKQAQLTGGVLDFIGLGGLSFLMVMSVLVIPMVQSLALLVNWFVPMTQKRRHRLSVFLEILHAWQYMEVYLLAILVGAWQLGSISEFLINPYCESLMGLFTELVYYGLIKEEDAQCFRTDVIVEPTFLVLSFAAIALALMNSFVMSSTAQYFRECDSLSQSQQEYKVSDTIACDDQFDDSQNNGKIHPVPVLFTDKFRWMLQREDAISSSVSLDTNGYGDHDRTNIVTKNLDTAFDTSSDDNDRDGQSAMFDGLRAHRGHADTAAWSEDEFDLEQTTVVSHTDGDIATVDDSTNIVTKNLVTAFDTSSFDNDGDGQSAMFDGLRAHGGHADTPAWSEDESDLEQTTVVSHMDGDIATVDDSTNVGTKSFDTTFDVSSGDNDRDGQIAMFNGLRTHGGQDETAAWSSDEFDLEQTTMVSQADHGDIVTVDDENSLVLGTTVLNTSEQINL